MIIPPDVSNTYMALGYTVVVLMLVGLIGYVANRLRHLRQEYATLSKHEEKTSARG